MVGCRRVSVLLFIFLTTFGSAQERQPYIINGIPTESFPAVGIVGEISVGGFCTGTLITPSHVLTAAHCGEAILAFGSGNSGTFEVGGRIYRTSSVEIISTYNNRLFTDDVAILVLAEPVLDIAPMQMSIVPPEVGELVTIVGFGGQGTPSEGSDGSFGQKVVGTVTVDNVSDTEFSWVFDDLSESNPAPGDSGGPVFIDTGEALLIAGIVSSGTAADAELGDTSFNMRVDAYESWITETVEITQAELDELNQPTDEQPAPEESLDPAPEPQEPEPQEPEEEPPAESEPGESDVQAPSEQDCRPPPPPVNECPAAGGGSGTTQGVNPPASEASVESPQDTPAPESPAPEEVAPEEVDSPAGATPPAGEDLTNESPATEPATPPADSVTDEEEASGEESGGSDAGNAPAVECPAPTVSWTVLSRRSRPPRYGDRRPTGSYRDASKHLSSRSTGRYRSRINVRR